MLLINSLLIIAVSFIVEPGGKLKRKFTSLPMKIKRECLGLRQSRQFTHDDEEDLIKAVKEREALWNNKLPVEERTIKIRSRLWDDIAEVLECNNIIFKSLF